MHPPRRPLAEIAELFVGLPAHVLADADAENGVLVLSVANLSDSGVSGDASRRASLDPRTYEKYRVKAGDVLLSARSTSARVGLVGAAFDGAVINSTLLAVRCSSRLDPRLLAAYLRSADGSLALEAVSQSGAAQMNLTARGLGRLEVPVPSAEEQHALVELVATADTAFESAISAARERRSLVTQLVNERLR